MMMPFPDEGPRDERGPLDPMGPSFDDRLAQQLVDRFRADPDLHRRHVHVEVQNGVALLTGTVDSPAVAESAVLMARATEGIRDVCNGMHLPEPGTESFPPPGRTDARQTAELEPGNLVSFEMITAKLMAEHPSLRRRVRVPQSRTAQVLLAVTAAIVWGLLSVLLVILLS